MRRPPVDPKGWAGAPEAEIEVTPEMIEAGVGVLYRYDGEGEEYWVETIYRKWRVSCRDAAIRKMQVAIPHKDDET